MVDPSIKANEREAARMFDRGVAAARGGQRRLAAGLLTRAVQLNPQHELGWLWLSGVVDEPREIAFCLQSVLRLNPANERARQGLAWLEQRTQGQVVVAEPPGGTVAPEPAPPPNELVPQEALPKPGRVWLRTRLSGIAERQAATVLARETSARHEGESWWITWRHNRRDMSRVRLVFWSVPILLLALTLLLHNQLSLAVARNQVILDAAAIPPTPVPVVLAVEARPIMLPILMTELPQVQDARVLAYLSAIQEPRRRLQTAVQSYRNATSKPGGSSVAHAAAARQLREEVDAAYTLLSELRPPAVLATAHALYLEGLQLERNALEEMLAFYSSFSVERVNRAALQMADAGSHLQRARDLFDQRLRLVRTESVGGHAIR